MAVNRGDVVVKRSRGLAVLQVLNFPSPGVGLVALALVFIMPTYSPWGGYVAVGLVLYLVVLCIRARSVRLVLDEDRLEVVNLLKRHSVPAGEIASLEWGRASMVTPGGDRCIDVLRTDGKRLHIEATVMLRVRRNAAGVVESRFDDAAVRRWAARRGVRFPSVAAVSAKRERHTRRK